MLRSQITAALKVLLLMPGTLAAALGAPDLSLPLDGDLSITPAHLRAEATGPYRFVDVAGRRGYLAMSLQSSLKIPCSVQQLDRGSIVLWVSPLETLTVSPPLDSVSRKDPHWQRYALVSDGWPGNDPEKSIFAWYWQSQWHPQMIAKFKSGAAGNTAADFGITPYVPVEHLPLHRGVWYQLALTWDKPASRLRIYVNGILCGTTSYPFRAEAPGAALFLGNTAMVFAGFEAHATELSAETLAKRYAREAVAPSMAVDEELRRLFTVLPPQSHSWQPGSDWRVAYTRRLTEAQDFAGWTQQGCASEEFRLLAREIGPEGLLIQTPNDIHTESRVYFWSPEIFEGDLAVEFEFRPEQPTGLALLVVQASGMQREDFLTDHPPRTSGSMDTIIADRVRNYHWEFFRHAVDVRGDLATQVLVKNPWMRPLAMSSLAPLKEHAWHRLLFVQEGERLRGSIDGVLAFDVRDDPNSHSGPVFDRGRIGLRLMYGTRMRFRNLTVWNRPSPMKAFP